MTSGKQIIKAKIITISGDGEKREQGMVENYSGDLESTLLNIAEKFNLHVGPTEVGKKVKGVHGNDR